MQTAYKLVSAIADGKSDLNIFGSENIRKVKMNEVAREKIAQVLLSDSSLTQREISEELAQANIKKANVKYQLC